MIYLQKLFFLVVIFAVCGLPASAQEKLTENTLKLTVGKGSPPATIADIEWLAGYWTGEAFGGESEEIWTPANGGSMIGMFRLVKDGRPVFYEFMTIFEKDGSLLLRLKHFNPDLTGWEEKDVTVDFPFVSKDKNAVNFGGLSFTRFGTDGLRVFLAMKQKDESFKEVKIEFKRRP